MNNVKCATTTVQQPIFRPSCRGSGRISSTKLGRREQFLQPTISPIAANVEPNQRTESSRYGDCTNVADATMVSSAAEDGNSATNKDLRIAANNMVIDRQAETTTEPQMDAPCLESIWRHHLEDHRWPERAVKQCMLSWAISTRKEYNCHIKKLFVFCNKTNTLFPPTTSKKPLRNHVHCYVVH